MRVHKHLLQKNELLVVCSWKNRDESPQKTVKVSRKWETICWFTIELQVVVVVFYHYYYVPTYSSTCCLFFTKSVITLQQEALLQQ